ncbi:MAG: hypothetical protein HQK53_01095 [Oligoflexia bacterium]|nr:hypothetical protein [Oligoflexia bacterium]
MRTRFLSLLFIIAAYSTSIFAEADLNVFNNSAYRICIAIAQATPLRTIGWYAVERGKNQSLTHVKYVHIRSCDVNGGVREFSRSDWNLSYFCVDPINAFNWGNPESDSICNRIGGSMASFYQLPEGRRFYNWFLNNWD